MKHAKHGSTGGGIPAYIYYAAPTRRAIRVRHIELTHGKGERDWRRAQLGVAGHVGPRYHHVHGRGQAAVRNNRTTASGKHRLYTHTIRHKSYKQLPYLITVVLIEFRGPHWSVDVMVAEGTNEVSGV